MGKPLIDLTGKKLNRWNVIDRAEKPETTTQTGAWWNCVCDCGTKKVVYGIQLTSKKGKGTKSCGCLKSEINSRVMTEMQFKKFGTIDDGFNSGYTINDESSCWVWNKVKDKDGYGIVYNKMKGTRAHRYSFEKYKGKIPEEMLVCHTCDVPSCVNPDHLFLGNHKDNINDMINKKRDRVIGIRNWNAKLTESEVIAIRESDMSYSFLGKKYNVSSKNIGFIKRNITWKHLL